MLKIECLFFDDLTDDEKENAPDNGFGKECATYIKVIYNDEVICLESDAMCPEDATFSRDLSWIKDILQKCYEIGKSEVK